ncbi:MAG: ABC transporter substrate-binding protein [Dongiaceae bacterium]
MHKNFKQDLALILEEKLRAGTIDRRTLVRSAAALGLTAAVIPGVAGAADKELVVVNWGGDAIELMANAWGKPFEEASGVKVIIDGSGPTEGSMKQQFESGAVRWDVCDAEAGSVINLGSQGMMEPIDYSIVDKNKVDPSVALEYGSGNYFFSYVIAYDNVAFAGNPPRNWVDFWDVEKFPGKRALYKWMNGVLEGALLADGVPVEELYPLDVDRAFKKIDELKPHIASFWGSGAEVQQMLREREISMGMIWNTRATLVREDTNGEVDWSFDNAIYFPSTWAVIKGNPAGPETAMQFIASCQDPESQVELLKAYGAGPANPAAHALVPDEFKAIDCSSPENVAKQIQTSIDWYAANYAAVLDRYLTFIAS